MFKNRFFICLLLLSIWFSTTGFQQPAQNHVTLPSAAAQAASFGKTYPADGAKNIPGKSLTLQWSAVQGYTGVVTYRYCLQTKTRCPGGKWIKAGSKTSVTVNNLAANTTYYWWVRAYNSQNVLIASADGGNSSSFTTMSLPDGFNKNVPANLSTDQPTSNLQISWYASKNADYYEYCLDTTNNNACDTAWVQVSTTSTTLNGLSNNAVYYWQVRAVNGGGSTLANGGGTWWQFTTHILPDRFNKLSPVNNAANQPINGLMLSWGISSSATDYQYCISPTSASCSQWQDAGSSTSVLVPASTLSYSSTYFWQVRAQNTGGNTPADGDTWWQFSTQAAPPGGFSKAIPANNTVTKQPVDLDLTWQISSGATSYEYCVTSIKSTPNMICDGPWTVVDSNTDSVFDLDYSTTYYWQVHAINDTGTTEANGGTWWSFTTQDAAPTIITYVTYLPIVVR